MIDFLWHKVSDKERENIKKEAKAIMDSFSKKLSKVAGKLKEPLIEMPQCEREENPEAEKQKLDKAIMFENACEKNSDFIIAERKKW